MNNMTNSSDGCDSPNCNRSRGISDNYDDGDNLLQNDGNVTNDDIEGHVADTKQRSPTPASSTVIDGSNKAIDLAPWQVH